MTEHSKHFALRCPRCSGATLTHTETQKRSTTAMFLSGNFSSQAVLVMPDWEEVVVIGAETFWSIVCNHCGDEWETIDELRSSINERALKALRALPE